MNIHNLDGCAPVPLAHYLKALGILRLVAEQADPGARGWWEGERFRLATRLDRAELEMFFRDHYQPTPLIAPWNKGSGFFYQNDPGLTPIENTLTERMTLVKTGIAAAWAQLDELKAIDETVRSIKEEAKITKEDRSRLRLELGIPDDKKFKLSSEQKRELKKREEFLKSKKKVHGETADHKKRLAESERSFKRLKTDFIPRIRLAWRGPHREWMDAAMVLGEDGLPRFPALLGTGGNDGRLDFTNNFLQRLNEVFDLSSPESKARPEAWDWFKGSIWGDPAIGCQTGSAVGQYLPGMAGGANSSNGPSADSLLNPIDFLLMLEGTVLFAAHMSRRLGASEQARAAAPFVVSGLGAGYASASVSDENARGEQWMPLWAQPLSLSELRRLLAEGRIQIGKRTSNEPIDVARAVTRMGSSRGIVAFQRYGYIERNGQSNLAVPLSRFQVPKNSSPRIACLDDLDRWLPQLRRQARAKEAPARLQLVERRLSDTLFAVTLHPDEPVRWQATLLALTDVEAILRTGSGFKAGPVPSLRPEWVEAADDGSAEFRLAVACALQSRFDPIRRHWLPMDKWQKRFATTGSSTQIRLESHPEVVMGGRKGIDDAVAIVQRRIIEARQYENNALRLFPAKRASAHPADLSQLLAGEANLDLTMRLASALAALNMRQWADAPCLPKALMDTAYPDDAWLAIRLAFLPFPLPPEDKRIPVDPAIVRRLESGDAVSAVKLALQRLRAAGIVTTIRVATVPPETALLWAAALVFPISKYTAADFIRRLDPNSLKEKI